MYEQEAKVSRVTLYHPLAGGGEPLTLALQISHSFIYLHSINIYGKLVYVRIVANYRCEQDKCYPCSFGVCSLGDRQTKLNF